MFTRPIAPDQVVCIRTVYVTYNLTSCEKPRYRLFVNVEHFQIISNVYTTKRSCKACNSLHDVVWTVSKLLNSRAPKGVCTGIHTGIKVFGGLKHRIDIQIECCGRF